MHRETGWWFTVVLTLLIPLSGCDTSSQSSRSSLFDNGRFMDLWSTYTHCQRSQNLDEMRADAEGLSRTVQTIDSAEGPILPEKNEPVPLGPTFRLSADPTAMAAACAIHTGQAAQEMGRLNVAQEMFHMVIIHFPQSHYQYYAAQARRGLEQLDAASRATLSGLTM
jgi:hypothetical protein